MRASDLLFAAASPDAHRSLLYRLGSLDGEEFARRTSRVSPDSAQESFRLRHMVRKHTEAAAAAPAGTGEAERLQAYAEGFKHGTAIQVARSFYKEEYQAMRDAEEAPDLAHLAERSSTAWNENAGGQEAVLATARFGLAAGAMSRKERLAAEQELAHGLKSGTAADALAEMQTSLWDQPVPDEARQSLQRFAARHGALLEEVLDDAALEKGARTELVQTHAIFFPASMQRAAKMASASAAVTPVHVREDEPAKVRMGRR